MSYEFYKLLHLLGVFLTITALAGAAHHVATGGTKQTNTFRKSVAMTHGIGLLLVLAAGFGALAKLGVHGFPLWVILKLCLWLTLGGLIAAIYKMPKFARSLWIATPVVAFLGALIANMKPS
jgi:hypothetical protein